MNAEALTFTTFAAGTASVYALFRLTRDTLFRNRRRIDFRMDDMLTDVGRDAVGQSSLFKKLQGGDVAEEGASLSFVARWEVAIEQSGLPLTLNRLFGIAGGTAAVAVFLTLLSTGYWALAIPSAALGFWLPFAIVKARQSKRQRRLADQLPEAFELMSRAVRAGQTMTSAMHLVGAEVKAPLGPEFQHCCDQQNLGLSQEVTLREMARRNGIMELQMFAVAVLVQRQSGGSPVEILDNLSQMVRKRIRLQGKVRALTGEGRMQAIVLTILPLVAFAAIYFLKRDYAEILLGRPWLLGGIGAAVVTGSVWIRKIVNFDF